MSHDIVCLFDGVNGAGGKPSSPIKKQPRLRNILENGQDRSPEPEMALAHQEGVEVPLLDLTFSDAPSDQRLLLKDAYEPRNPLKS